MAYSASTDTTLETAASIRSDCDLTPTAPVRKGADSGAGNPRFFRRGFVLPPIGRSESAEYATSTANRDAADDASLPQS